jgi:hypothetical protein
MRALYVIFCKLKGVAKRVVNMTLCCEVHHDVDLLAAEDVVEKIHGTDVTLDEFDVQKFSDHL